MEGEKYNSKKKQHNAGKALRLGMTTDDINTGVVHTIFKINKVHFDRQKILNNIESIFPDLQ
jgi:hypothetical protein